MVLMTNDERDRWVSIQFQSEVGNSYVKQRAVYEIFVPHVKYL